MMGHFKAYFANTVSGAGGGGGGTDRIAVSGRHDLAAGTDITFAGPFAPGNESISVGDHAIPAGLTGNITELYYKPLTNSILVGSVFTVMLDEVATALTVTVPATSTALVSSVGNSIAVTAGQMLVLRGDITGAGKGSSIQGGFTYVLEA